MHTKFNFLGLSHSVWQLKIYILYGKFPYPIHSLPSQSLIDHVTILTTKKIPWTPALTLTDWSTCRPHAIRLAGSGCSANQGVARIAGVGGHRTHCGSPAVQKLAIVDRLDFPAVHWPACGGRVWPHPSTLALPCTNANEGKTSIAAVCCHVVCDHNSAVVWGRKLGALLSYTHTLMVEGEGKG